MVEYGVLAYDRPLYNKWGGNLVFYRRFKTCRKMLLPCKKSSHFCSALEQRAKIIHPESLPVTSGFSVLLLTNFFFIVFFSVVSKVLPPAGQKCPNFDVLQFIRWKPAFKRCEFQHNVHKALNWNWSCLSRAWKCYFTKQHREMALGYFWNFGNVLNEPKPKFTMCMLKCCLRLYVSNFFFYVFQSTDSGQNRQNSRKHSQQWCLNRPARDISESDTATFLL